jgi:predicted PurR-regulated permease PerM
MNSSGRTGVDRRRSGHDSRIDGSANVIASTTSDAAVKVSDDNAPRVPRLLATLAAWSWRLIVVGVVVYALMQIVSRLFFVALPLALALLLCALLMPVTDRLRRWGLNSLTATWVTILLALAVVAGVGTLVGVRANSEFPKLVSELRHTGEQMQRWLVNGPFHLKQAQLDTAIDKLLANVQEQRGKLITTALSATATVGEIAAGLVLMLFITFFLLKDGRLIWSWLISGTGNFQDRLNRAGQAGWVTLSHYVHGTVIVAAIHGIIIAIVLTVMGVPLVAPLAVLIFFASFIPLVGILFAGAVALAVVLSAKGLIAGLVFLGILIVEHQLESHVLQPLVIGRQLRFHPLAIIMILAVGGVIGGIPGAALSVPVAAVFFRAWPHLSGSKDPPPLETESSPRSSPPPETGSPPKTNSPDGAT